jgi:hypothetical protein
VQQRPRPVPLDTFIEGVRSEIEARALSLSAAEIPV